MHVRKKNQNIITTRKFVIDLKNKLEKFKTLNKKELLKLNKVANEYNIVYAKKHKLDLIEEIFYK